MTIELNRLHYPVTTLGHGRRIGVWVQGCTIHCPGCIARDTWDPDPGRAVDIDLILAWCRDVAGAGPDGVTISGGEPFQQPDGLTELLEALHAWRDELTTPFDILCYSGYPLRRLAREHADILDLLDALIPEPFMQRRPRGAIWRGSDNQPLVALSDLGVARYRSIVDHEPEGRLQVAVDGSRIWYIGIPDRGDLEALERRAAAKGVIHQDVSWRP